MDISLISINSLLIIIFILIIIGSIEMQMHLKSLDKIPIRIHVNGTRGKSSVVRLIASGLRNGGYKTLAKTTGTVPRIINENGKDIELHRLRSASIGEQIKLIRYFSKQSPDVMVVECMAVNPQYQWISEHRIVRSNVSVITNVRKDHVDEMGATNKDIAYSLSNTIPYNSKLFTSEKKYFNIFKKVSKYRNTNIARASENNIDKEYLNNFHYLEHPENISLALEVCKELGVSENKALEGMLNTTPDPGALLIWDIKNNNNFVSAFAANDPDSTLKVWNLIENKFNNKICFFLNTRNDRRYRTLQLIDLVVKKINPDLFIIRGDNINSKIYLNNESIKFKIFAMDTSQDEVIDYILQLKKYSVIGIGNMVGWGEIFLQQLEEYKI
tara:strand:+ start:499 stop:1653 length:1155 start_codon:yes stop_codon:yes gene_type:complete